jgi:hypothetical protein
MERKDPSKSRMIIESKVKTIYGLKENFSSK